MPTSTLRERISAVSPIDHFLQCEIDLGSFASAVYAVGSSSRGITAEGALGNAVAVPLRIPASTATLYDCASITKPLVTGTLVMMAVAEKRIALDDLFEGFTYRELLTHTSGLDAWLPLYSNGRDYLRTIVAHGRTNPAGRVIYSDLNFVLLYYALERIYGSYRDAAREKIFAPLGLADATLAPSPSKRPRIAATEWGQRWERGMCAQRSVVFTGFREGLMWGETNDGNSFHHGGTAGNAGLFATAREVFRIAQSWANAELLPRELVDEATRNHTPDLEDGRGLAWQKPTGSAATSMLSESAYGHTGFTGTSVWIDPQADRIMVLLTNRVHPCAAQIAMQRIRGEFHRLALG